jgi:hypothetical protein
MSLLFYNSKTSHELIKSITASCLLTNCRSFLRQKFIKSTQSTQSKQQMTQKCRFMNSELELKQELNLIEQMKISEN